MEPITCVCVCVSVCDAPEGEFGLEHSLTLQSCALADEQVVVVTLQWSFIHIKHLIPQVQRHAAEREKAMLISRFLLNFIIRAIISTC